MFNSFPRSLVVDPVVEAALRDSSAARHCVYVARLVTQPPAAAEPAEERPLQFMYPSGACSSIVNIGEGASFLERWLMNDKAKHIVDLANYLRKVGVSEFFGFRIVVDAFAIDPKSQAESIELMLERSFMAACHCPPFFQELRGRRKKLTLGKEARLYFQDYDFISDRANPTSRDFGTIEKHVLGFVDTTGQALWRKYTAAANAFFGQCATSRNDVSMSFDVGRDTGHLEFGDHLVSGVSGELPTGKGKDKHHPKVACYKLLQQLASDVSTTARSIKSPLSIPVGQNGKHGTLAAMTHARASFQFTNKHGRPMLLDSVGNRL